MLKTEYESTRSDNLYIAL